MSLRFYDQSSGGYSSILIALDSTTHTGVAKGKNTAHALPEEIKAVLEVGYEYVCEREEWLFFRKRK